MAALPTARILERAKGFKVRGSGLGRTIAPVSLTKENQRRFLNTFQARFVPTGVFVDLYFTGLSRTLHNFWFRAVEPLLVGMYRLCEASQRQSPQSRAYQSAIASLFHEEKARLCASNAPVRDLDRAALEFAHTAAGIAPPTVDLKLHLQHVWSVFAYSGSSC